MKKILFIILIGFTFIMNVKAMDNLAPNSKSTILLETSTGTLSPASMNKIMIA